MRSWEHGEIPVLGDPAPATSLLIFDSAKQKMQPIVQDLDPHSDFRMYVCGITPYDAAHLGHASTYIAFDLLQRAVRDLGFGVHYVQNITDVDDPLLERALITGDHWSELAEREIARFRDDMQALGVIPPAEFLGVVESMSAISSMIDQLRNTGAAYQVDQDWYFDTSMDSAFGLISQLSHDAMMQVFAERGGDPARAGKKNSLDPLLWMARRDSDPYWESPMGQGRPGWHVECVAIATAMLGVEFDLQGGGSDLIFPHHQMCDSLARVQFRQPFATFSAHTGMVALDGEKMSKSKGNLEFVSRLREQGNDPMAIRLALMAQHYRSDWEWKPELLERATARLQRWRSALARDTTPDVGQLVSDLRSALSQDLDSPAALDFVDQWANTSGDDLTGSQRAADAINALLGVRL